MHNWLVICMASRGRGLYLNTLGPSGAKACTVSRCIPSRLWIGSWDCSWYMHNDSRSDGILSKHWSQGSTIQSTKLPAHIHKVQVQCQSQIFPDMEIYWMNSCYTWALYVLLLKDAPAIFNKYQPMIPESKLPIIL